MRYLLAASMAFSLLAACGSEDGRWYVSEHVGQVPIIGDRSAERPVVSEDERCAINIVEHVLPIVIEKHHYRPLRSEPNGLVLIRELDAPIPPACGSWEKCAETWTEVQLHYSYTVYGLYVFGGYVYLPTPLFFSDTWTFLSVYVHERVHEIGFRHGVSMTDFVNEVTLEAYNFGMQNPQYYGSCVRDSFT